MSKQNVFEGAVEILSEKNVLIFAIW